MPRISVYTEYSSRGSESAVYLKVRDNNTGMAEELTPYDAIELAKALLDNSLSLMNRPKPVAVGEHAWNEPLAADSKCTRCGEVFDSPVHIKCPSAKVSPVVCCPGCSKEFPDTECVAVGADMRLFCRGCVDYRQNAARGFPCTECGGTTLTIAGEEITCTCSFPGKLPPRCTECKFPPSCCVCHSDTIVRCPGCSKTFAADECVDSGNRLVCKVCHEGGA